MILQQDGKTTSSILPDGRARLVTELHTVVAGQKRALLHEGTVPRRHTGFNRVYLHHKESLDRTTVDVRAVDEEIAPLEIATP